MVKPALELQPEPESAADEELKLLFNHLRCLHAIDNSIRREYELIQASKKHDIPLDIFRQMFKDYCQQTIETEWLGRFRWRTHFEAVKRNLKSFVILFTYLSSLAGISILGGVLTYVWEFPQRAEQVHYQAWQIVSDNQGETASIGRMSALQHLNRDGVSLAGVNLNQTILFNIKLKKADLTLANLNNTILWEANLEDSTLYKAKLNKADLTDARLRRADLSNASLINADLSGADLRDAKLVSAELMGANLSGANLEGASLNDADLTGAVYSQETKFPKGYPNGLEVYKLFPGANLSHLDLQNVSLYRADLREADLTGTDLRGASLEATNFTGANLQGADLRGVRDMTARQITRAKNWNQAQFDDDFRRGLGIRMQSIVPGKANHNVTESQ